MIVKNQCQSNYSYIYYIKEKFNKVKFTSVGFFLSFRLELKNLQKYLCKLPKIKVLSVGVLYLLECSTFSQLILVESDTQNKNPRLVNLTLEKHLIKLIFNKKNKLYIKSFQKIFFYAFNTIIKLFFTIRGVTKSKILMVID